MKHMEKHSPLKMLKKAGFTPLEEVIKIPQKTIAGTAYFIEERKKIMTQYGSPNGVQLTTTLPPAMKLLEIRYSPAFFKYTLGTIDDLVQFPATGQIDRYAKLPAPVQNTIQKAIQVFVYEHNLRKDD